MYGSLGLTKIINVIIIGLNCCDIELTDQDEYYSQQQKFYKQLYYVYSNSTTVNKNVSIYTNVQF